MIADRMAKDDLWREWQKQMAGNSSTHPDNLPYALHVNGHALRQPVLVQVVRLSAQIHVGLLRLEPFQRAIKSVP